MHRNVLGIVVLFIIVVVGSVFLVASHEPRHEPSEAHTEPSVSKEQNLESAPLMPTTMVEPRAPEPAQVENDAVDVGAPKGLSLPFLLTDINKEQGLLNPLGVVRSSKDEASIGHSGLDIPLAEGTAMYAVADGEIVRIVSADDPWGGQGIFQLLVQTGAGEGWAFIYEHVEPREGLSVGDRIVRGELIGTKIAPNDFTVHLQLARVFNNFQFTSDNQCWPDLLQAADREALYEWWEEYRASSVLVRGWETVMEEGRYPFRGLLNKAVYPEGPKLCYPAGTDVR